MFDERIDSYNVYKVLLIIDEYIITFNICRLKNYKSKYLKLVQVETIGDAYLVAGGVPEKTDHHASEIAKMALDLLSKVFPSFIEIYKREI